MPRVQQIEDAVAESDPRTSGSRDVELLGERRETVLFVARSAPARENRHCLSPRNSNQSAVALAIVSGFQTGASRQ